MLITVRVSSWEKARLLASHLHGDIFRGQEDACWGLTTTLERAAEIFMHPKEALPRSEVTAIKEFKKRAHFYLDYAPTTQKNIDWLSIIQHHSGPTRLLDFTYSFYVASFFAVSQAKADAAVWVANPSELLSRSHQIVYPERYKGADDFDKFIEVYSVRKDDMLAVFEESFYPDLFLKNNRVVIPIEPSLILPRSSIQQGLFLAPCSVQYSFEECLNNTINTDIGAPCQEKIIEFSSDTDVEQIINLYESSGIMKIIIERKCHKAAVEDLWKMNINAASLFPDLDGFAKSLVYFFRAHETNDEEYSKKVFNRIAAVLNKMGME